MFNLSVWMFSLLLYLNYIFDILAVKVAIVWMWPNVNFLCSRYCDFFYEHIIHLWYLISIVFSFSCHFSHKTHFSVDQCLFSKSFNKIIRHTIFFSLNAQSHFYYAALLRFTLWSRRQKSTGNVNHEITQNNKSS